MAPKRLIGSLGLLGALAICEPAHADQAVAELQRDTPIAAYGGVVAWSDFDAPAGRYRLVLRLHGKPARAPIAGQPRAFDVSLGPDARGRVVALYTRCRVVTAKTTRGCDVYRLDVAAGRERKLASVSSPHADEAWPAQWGPRVTFVRRAQAYIKNAYNRHPDPRGRRGGGEKAQCDIPYVQTPASTTPRRLDRGPCAPTTGVSIRGGSIVQVTDVDYGGAGSESQVRRLDARGGVARVLARTTGGEGGYSPFASPSQSASTVWVTRIGLRLGEPAGGFTKIDVGSKRVVREDPLVTLAGRVVRDERGTFWYVQAAPQVPESNGEPPFCTGATVPCRLVRAYASPFSHAARTLTPEVTIVPRQPNGEIMALYTDPPVLAGELSRRTVRDGAVVGHTPLAGVRIELWQTENRDGEGTYRSTGRSGTTDAAGHWSFAFEQPPPSKYYRLVAPALQVASDVMRVAAAARVTLTTAGHSLAGTVTPAQPGRSVAIQRRDPARCATGRHGVPVCDDRAWVTVGTAPLDAAGTAFSATVPGAGTYRADLPFDDTPHPTASYQGRSVEVQVP